jgi:Holliday junction DNA helicase RuvA
VTNGARDVDRADPRWYEAGVISRLSGVLIEKTLDAVVVDVQGVGFQVAVSLNTLTAIGQVGQPVQLLTYLVVREDALSLYGFATAEERRAFELCIGVSGIGPKLAIALLSGLDGPGLFKAVSEGDAARLKRVPGIGPKTAERLVMELRDKVPRAGGAAADKGRTAGSASTPGRGGLPAGMIGDVAGALCNLGYKPADAERAAERAHTEEPAASVEVVLRRALRLLQRD